MGLSKFLPTMGQNCIQMPQSSTIFYKQFSVWSKNVVKSKVKHSTGSNSPPPHPTHARFKFPTPRAWKTVKFPWVVQGERKNVEASNRLVHKKCIFCFRAERHMYTVPLSDCFNSGTISSIRILLFRQRKIHFTHQNRIKLLLII